MITVSIFINDTPIYTRSARNVTGDIGQKIHTYSDRSQTEPVGIMRDLRIPIGCLRRVTKL